MSSIESIEVGQRRYLPKTEIGISLGLDIPVGTTLTVEKIRDDGQVELIRSDTEQKVLLMKGVYGNFPEERRNPHRSPVNIVSNERLDEILRHLKAGDKNPFRKNDSVFDAYDLLCAGIESKIADQKPAPDPLAIDIQTQVYFTTLHELFFVDFGAAFSQFRNLFSLLQYDRIASIPRFSHFFNFSENDLHDFVDFPFRGRGMLRQEFVYFIEEWVLPHLRQELSLKRPLKYEDGIKGSVGEELLSEIEMSLIRYQLIPDLETFVKILSCSLS